MPRLLPALVAVVALAGCGEVPDFPVLAPTAAAESSATLRARGWIDVPLEVAGAASVTVAGGAVFSPYFERLEAVEIGVDVAEGEPAVVTLPLGEAVCPAGGGASSLQVVLEADGREILQTVVLDDAALAEIHEDECRTQRATDAASPALGLPTGIEDGVVRTTVVVTRGESVESVVLEEIEGSEVFSVTAVDGALPAELVAGRLRLEVPVEIAVAACPADGEPADAAYRFDAWMSVGGGDPTRVVLEAQASLKEALDDVLAECAAADG